MPSPASEWRWCLKLPLLDTNWERLKSAVQDFRNGISLSGYTTMSSATNARRPACSLLGSQVPRRRPDRDGEGNDHDG